MDWRTLIYIALLLAAGLLVLLVGKHTELAAGLLGAAIQAAPGVRSKAAPEAWQPGTRVGGGQ